MVGGLAALDPHKAVLPVIALIGLVPVLLQYRDRSKWFVVGYVMLVVAALSTNLENLFLGGVLNHSEHVVGLMGSGIAFLVAGYLRRQQVLAERDESDAGDSTAEAAG